MVTIGPSQYPLRMADPLRQPPEDAGADALGRLVRRRRADLGLTQEELAERVGGNMTQSDVSQIERGAVRRPGRDRLARLALALRVPLGDLVAASGWAELARAADAAPPAFDPDDPLRAPVVEALAELDIDRLKSLADFANYLLKQEGEQRRRRKRAGSETA